MGLERQKSLATPRGAQEDLKQFNCKVSPSLYLVQYFGDEARLDSSNRPPLVRFCQNQWGCFILTAAPFKNNGRTMNLGTPDSPLWGQSYVKCISRNYSMWHLQIETENSRYSGSYLGDWKLYTRYYMTLRLLQPDKSQSCDFRCAAHWWRAASSKHLPVEVQSVTPQFMGWWGICNKVILSISEFEA